MEEEQPSSFGIKKIVDCKIGEGGQQMYKVKWEPTWEPAENLASCQHLIDTFWLFVNKAKTNEVAAQQHRKRKRLEQCTNNNILNIDQNFDRLSDDNKAEVQRLLARVNETAVGSPILMSPSNMLLSAAPHGRQNNLMGMVQTLNQTNNQTFPTSPQTLQNLWQQQQQQNSALNMSSPVQKSNFNFGLAGGGATEQKSVAFGNKGNVLTPPAKIEADDLSNLETKADLKDTTKSSNTTSTKYLENFSSPYVKLIIVCKICNKEAAKNPGNWKVHYLTHASNEEKPHKCHICNKGFVQSNKLKTHMSKNHPVKQLQQQQQDFMPDEEPEIKHKPNFESTSYF